MKLTAPLKDNDIEKLKVIVYGDLGSEAIRKSQ